MSALTILALVLVVPVMLIPVVLVWYINAAGLREAVKAAKRVKIRKLAVR